MSLEKIKQLANSKLVTIFESIIKTDHDLRQWRHKVILQSNLADVMNEIKKVSSAREDHMLSFSVAILDMPHQVYLAVNQSNTIADCVDALIAAHKQFAESYPSPTKFYAFRQSMEGLVKDVLNTIVTENLVDTELKERITTHLATQKIATTRGGASYSFGFLKDKSVPDHADNKREPAPKNRM